MSSAGDPFHHRRAEDHSNRPFKGRSKSTRSKSTFFRVPIFAHQHFCRFAAFADKGEEKVRPSLKKRDLRGDKEQRQNKFKQHMADQRHQQQSARRFAAGGTEGPPKLVVWCHVDCSCVSDSCLFFDCFRALCRCVPPSMSSLSRRNFSLSALIFLLRLLLARSQQARCMCL